MKAATLSIVTIAYLATLLAVTASAQRERAPQPALPPLSMTCPHHPDVIESRPGTCPLCKMTLVPVRLDAAWMCPVHTNVIESRAGACRLCRRQLIQVTVSLTWTCLAEPGIDRINPGTCPDGSPTVPRRTLRPHGNHNPQYGGQFFMAPDNWHHLEGTYPRAGLFRLYLYDDYARPLAADQIKRVRARVVTKETFDPATRKTTELAAFPLRASRNGAYLEARVDAGAFPAEMTAKVRFGSDAPEYRFDFTFAALTKAPVPPAAPRTASGAARKPEAGARAGETTAGDPAGAASTTPPGVLDPVSGLPNAEIPDSMSGIVDRLKARHAEIGEIVKRGDFGAVWVPAFQAKDLAIALEPHLAHLPPAQREVGEPAIKALVRAAWLLDSWGDVGNRQQIEAAFASFTSAITDLNSAFTETAR